MHDLEAKMIELQIQHFFGGGGGGGGGKGDSNLQGWVKVENQKTAFCLNILVRDCRFIIDFKTKYLVLKKIHAKRYAPVLISLYMSAGIIILFNPYDHRYGGICDTSAWDDGRGKLRVTYFGREYPKIEY